jgi:hypothetical protein
MEVLMKPILLYPVKVQDGRTTFEGIDFDSLQELAEYQAVVGFQSASVIANGTLYDAENAIETGAIMMKNETSSLQHRGYKARKLQRQKHWTPIQNAGVLLLNAAEYIRSNRGQFGPGTIFTLSHADYIAVTILQYKALHVAGISQ